MEMTGGLGEVMICKCYGFFFFFLIFLKNFHFQNCIPCIVLLSSHLFLDLLQGFQQVNHNLASSFCLNRLF